MKFRQIHSMTLSTLACALGLMLTVHAQEWHTAEGCRWHEVSLHPSEQQIGQTGEAVKSGFREMPREKTGIMFSNVLSQWQIIENGTS
jgi:hypothetical protein